MPIQPAWPILSSRPSSWQRKRTGSSHGKRSAMERRTAQSTTASASPTIAFQALAFPALTSLAPFSLVHASRTPASSVPAPALLHHLSGAILSRAEMTTFQRRQSRWIPGRRRTYGPRLTSHPRCVGDIVLSYALNLAPEIRATVNGQRHIPMRSRSLLSAIAFLTLAVIWGSSQFGFS